MLEGFWESLRTLFPQKRVLERFLPNHNPDCSVRLIMSSWSERERVVKSAL